MKDQAEVCPVSRGMMSLSLNSYPSHCKMAFAFSAILCLHPQRRSLRFALPFKAGIQVYHVPHNSQTDGLGPAYSPMALLSVYSQCRREYPATFPFG